jgi:stress response protein YsnF
MKPVRDGGVRDSERSQALPLEGTVVPSGGRLMSGWTVRIPVRAEQVTVEKRPVVVEQVSVERVRAEESLEVDETIQREQLWVEGRSTSPERREPT